jgi:flagellar basal-body rod protein FlgB
MIGGLESSGTIQVLETTLRFAAQRQRLIAHNIANVTTPNFQVKDVSVEEFRSVLARAVEEHRRVGGGRLELKGSSRIVQRADGGLELHPGSGRGGVLFHDRNNRDLERLMQDLAENAAAFRLSADLLRSRMELLRSAIGQRV